MLQNAIGGLQGIIDHAMVGHFVGFTANAAIGVSWQIFLVVIVFIASLFTGMGVLVARFAGANDHERVDRTVYQAFLVARGARRRHHGAARIRALAHAARSRQRDAGVRAEALPYLRTMFLFSIGMLMFFMLGGALRAAGDARTPLRLGVCMTVLNIASEHRVHPRAWDRFRRSARRARRSARSSRASSCRRSALWLTVRRRMVIHFPRHMSWAPDWAIIRSLFRFGLPAGIQGVAMNVAGVMLLRFIGSLEHSAEAQAAYAVGYAELFSLITWTSVGLMGAAAAVAGQNLGAGHPERASARCAHCRADRPWRRGHHRRLFLLIPEHAARHFRPERSDRRRARLASCCDT